jgi:hypothetical protein
MTDFMVLDMGAKDEETPIILRRPFLNTTNAIVFIGSVQVYFLFLDGKVRCHFNSYTTHEQSKKLHNRRKRRSHCQVNQSLKDGWADYPGEVVRYEDRWNKWDTEDKKIEEPTKKEATPPKSGTQTTQVWKEKTTLTSSPQKKSKHLSLPHRDQMMHLKSKYSLLPSPV